MQTISLSKFRILISFDAETISCRWTREIFLNQSLAFTVSCYCNDFVINTSRVDSEIVPPQPIIITPWTRQLKSGQSLWERRDWLGNFLDTQTRSVFSQYVVLLPKENRGQLLNTHNNCQRKLHDNFSLFKA